MKIKILEDFSQYQMNFGQQLALADVLIPRDQESVGDPLYRG